MEDVWSRQENITLFSIWYCKEGWTRFGWCWSISKQSVVLPILNLVGDLSVPLHFQAKKANTVKEWYVTDLRCCIACSYQHHEGQMRLRATTLSRRWVAGSGGVQASFSLTFFTLVITIIFCLICRWVSPCFSHVGSNRWLWSRGSCCSHGTLGLI